MIPSRARLGQNIRADLTRTLPIIGEIHHFIHAGVVYDYTAKVVVPASSGVSLIGQTNGNSVHFHQEQYSASTGGLEIVLEEGVSYTGGTEVFGRNRNRRSDKQHDMTLLQGATITEPGEQLYIIGIPSAGTQPVARASGEAGELMEWVLKPDTAYAITLTNTTASPITVYVDFAWYEPGQLDT